jgi:hypothetical protein
LDDDADVDVEAVDILEGWMTSPAMAVVKLYKKYSLARIVSCDQKGSDGMKKNLFQNKEK